MTIVLKRLAWLAAAVLGLTITTYLVWLAGNLFDDELNPEVKRIVSAAPAQIDQKENAYFTILGLDASGDQDAHAFGLKRFEEMVAADREPGNGGGVEITPQGKLPIKPSDIPCQKAEACFEEVRARGAAVQQVLDQEAGLLGRLDGMLEAPYQEPHRRWTYGSRIPSYATYNAAVQLASARFALLAQEGRYEDALRDWARLAKFAETQSERSESLLAKLVALKTLHRQHLLLAQFINTYPAAAQANAKTMAGILPPLSKNQAALTPAIQSEAALVANGNASTLPDLRRLIGSEAPGMPPAVFDPVLKPFYKANATVNQATDRMLAWAQLDGLAGADYRNRLLALQGEQVKGKDFALRYRNPIGQVLVSVAAEDFGPYFYRRDSLVAERHLMAFVLQSLENGCNADAIRKALPLHPELAHPFTGQHPVWDEVKRSLSYAAPTGMEPQPGFAALGIAIPDACPERP